MSLDVPKLDDRTYAEIIEEARQRIPVHSETWTDHNASDPGITILELLAWLAETYTYQLDQITDAHRLKYLELVGEQPRPPRPAGTDLRMTLPKGASAARVPESTRLIATDANGARYGFETAAEALLTTAQLERVVVDGPHGRHDRSAANETAGMHYSGFGETAVEGGKLYLGFDGNPFFGTEALHGTRALQLAVRLHEDGLPNPTQHGEASDSWTEQVEFEPSVRVEWQHCTDYENWHRDEAWERLEVVHDETDRFYRSGRITLERPASWLSTGDTLFEEERRYRWVRCLLTEDGYEIAPRIDSLAVNVVPVEHHWEQAEKEIPRGSDERTGSTESSGRAYTVKHRPEPNPTAIDAENSETAIHATGGAEGNIPASTLWEFERPSVELWAKSGGRGGGAPEEITIEQRRAATGGVDAESIDEAFDRVIEDRTIPYRAVSLADYEYLATHTPGLRFGRATATIVEHEPVRKHRRDHGIETSVQCEPGSRHERTRIRDPLGTSESTINRGSVDPEQGGEETVKNDPGSVGDRDPDEHCEPHREVQVVVVPFSRSSRPTPSDGFRKTVERHLELHRLLTDRVRVKCPTYVDVGVEVKVTLDPGYAVSDRETAIEAAVKTFLDPLRGFEGDGWPFGRALYRSELYEVIENVAGVDCVTGLTAQALDESRIDTDGTLVIEETELLSLKECVVTARVSSPGTGGRCK